MALQIHCPSSFTRTLNLNHSTKPYCFSRSQFAVKSQSDSNPPTRGTTGSDPQAEPQPRKLGFGSAPASPDPAKESGNKKRGGKRERASIIRRSPLEKPAFAAAVTTAEEEEKARERGRSENAFLLTWLGLGSIILVQGIALAASGFLPEEWDKFLVKYLYPSFTPTVGFFISGTVAYGVSKYLQNEKLKDQK